MFKQLSNNIFQKRTQKYLHATARNTAFINYTQANSILLVFESNYTEKNSEIKKIIDNMNADGKKVVAIGYVDKKKSMSATYPEYMVFSNNDLTMFEKPKHDIIQHLMQDEYDLLIDITTKSLLPLEYIVLYANAKCKTGMKKRNLKLYDFAVEMDDYLLKNEIVEDDLSITFLHHQILFYLKSIESKDF